MITRVIVFCFFTLAIASRVAAQDTTRKRTIDITSSFKPVLRDPAKVNFNAAPPLSDTGRPRLTYNIPSENLMFMYQPGELKPLSYGGDSTSSWPYSNYIKVGIGNVHQPYVGAGFSFGDGQSTFFNLFAQHYTSKGSKPFQKNSRTYVAGTMTYKTPKQLEWNGGLSLSSDDYFLYGIPPTGSYTKDQLKQRFQKIEGKLSLRNIVPTELGISYQPSLRVSVFGDNHDPKGTEANSVLTLPVSKIFGKATAFNLGVTADLTHYRRKDIGSINNNIFLITPSVQFKTPNFYLNAGLTPSWENGNFKMLPNIMADITTDDQRFTLQTGLIGYFNKGSYTRFATVNPWLAQPDSLANDRVSEFYAGFKGSMGDHFSYSAKVAMQQHHGIALFVNNPVDMKDFLIRYERQLNIFNTHAEAEYTVGEQFNAKATFDWNRFSKQKSEAEAWGLLPLELSAQLRWQAFKGLWFRSELWAFDGAQYLRTDNKSYKGEAGFDLNFGAEFKIVKNLDIWIQMNNIFNNRYERWNRYEVFGFNILGGIIYSFNQK